MTTAQGRRIIRELSVIYLIYGTAVAGWSWGIAMSLDAGSWPQWITAIVALFAVLVAATGIIIQWWLARKRAAIDFFLKTEADKHLLEAYDKFHAGVEQMKSMTIDVFCTSKDEPIREHYFAVRKYLNIHELIAVGIKNGMFHDRTCYDFWAGILFRGVDAARPVIDHVRRRPGREATYSELEILYTKWKKLERKLARRGQ
jgi:Domain of unknown function (DUF4760)